MINMENHFITKHKLTFEVAKSPYEFVEHHLLFRIGTCEGQWVSIDDCYVIISVKNNNRGNGHLDDVFEWFEFSCKRDNKNLLVVEFINERFYKHCLSKRGFIAVGKRNRNCVKVFNQEFYESMIVNGNEILTRGTLQC